MKKILPIVVAVLMILVLSSRTNNDYYIIPDSAIRLRIIANSNSTYDQSIKKEIKKVMENELKDTISINDTIETSRTKIKKNLKEYENLISKTLDKEHYNKDFTINYGYNYFPQKEYKGVIYEAGDYESLVVTLGEGKGNNWWCVLFPPLCTLEVKEETDVEYHLFIKDFIEKHLK